MRILQPPDWVSPRGYSNGIVATGQLVFLAGQIGWDGDCNFVSDKFAAQAKQELINICTILAEAGGKPEHITHMTWYVVDKEEYKASYKELGAVYRDVMGKHFPTMTAIEVSGLIEDAARVEIEARAVIPQS